MDIHINKKHKWILVFAIIGIVIVIAILIGVGTWYFSPMQRFMRYFEQNNLTEAALYTSKMSEQELEYLEQPLYSKAKAAYNAYNEGTISYDEALNTIRQTRAIHDSEKQEEVELELQLLLKSKESYSSAQNQSDIIKAIHEFYAVIESDTFYDSAQKQAQQLKVKYKQEILSSTEELISRDAFQEALILLEESYVILDEDRDISGQIEYCTKMIENNITKEALAVAAGYASEGDYSSAITTLTAVTITNAEITEKIGEYRTLYRQCFFEKAAAYFAANEYEAAIAFLEEGIQKCGNDDEFMVRIAEYKAKYKKTFLDDAEKFASAGKYEEAVACLNASIPIFHDDKDIEEKIAEYTKKYPVYLYDLSPCMGKNHAEEKEYQDIYGNEYSKGLRIWSYDNTDVFEYVANRQYKRFTSTILISSGTDDYVELSIKIFADDRLLYNSGNMTKKTEPIKLDLNISGVQIIRFEVIIDGDVYNFRSGSLLLSDPAFRY